MKSILLSILLIVFAAGHVPMAAFAGEEKTEKAEGSGKKEEGGEKKEGAEDSMPWLAIEAKIQELSAKIESKKESINKLLEEKEKLKDGSSELKEKIQQLVSEHKALEKMADDYASQINLLKYRYPERHAKRDRKYDRVEVKSIDEMEQALGVDGKLNRNMARMRNTYDVQPPKKEKAAQVEKKDVKPKGNTLENQLPIIMQK
jgi:chromosome segregation ATPase